MNGEKVDALISDRPPGPGREWGVRICDSLRDEIPRHQFKIAIQGAIGGKIISRSTISAFRKDVTAKCYGGDITRKRKLLEKQKAGKKRMKMVGSVEIPQSAFMAALKTENEFLSQFYPGGFSENLWLLSTWTCWARGAWRSVAWGSIIAGRPFYLYSTPGERGAHWQTPEFIYTGYLISIVWGSHFSL